MGTLPMMSAGRSHCGVPASTAHKKSSAGPRVISRYSSEGGYFVVFKNDNAVKTADFCVSHGTGSPYKLTPRKTTNAALKPAPSGNRNALRRADGQLKICPRPYPAAVTPTHGIST